MPLPRCCDLCGRSIEPHAHYVVRIEVFADPSTPPMNTDELGSTADAELSMAELMAKLDQSTAEQLQDQVHRRFDFAICASCQPKFLRNPLGMPRQVRMDRVGHN